MERTTGHPRRWARVTRFVSTILILAGAILLLVAAGLQAYTMYAQTKWEREQQVLSANFLPAPALPPEDTPSPTIDMVAAAPAAATATPTPEAVATPASAPVATETNAIQPSVTPTSSPTRLPTVTPTPDDRSDPGVLIIPKLKVSATIVFVPLIKGEWDITKIIYETALLGGTGFPGRTGNAALAGHVSLKGRGDGPFRWLEKLAPGDEVYIQQGTTRYMYRVQSSRAVQPTDVSVLAPTRNATLTLITCTDWDYLKVEYTHRLVVTASLISQQTVGAISQ